MSRGRRNRNNPRDVQRAALQLLEKAMAPGGAAMFGRADGGTVPQGRSLVSQVQALTGQQPSEAGTFGAVPMSRNPLDNVPFGPLWPLNPDPFDPARRDTGRPEPRVSDYPVAWNLPGSGERLIPFRVLREAADGVDLIRRCIEIRKRHIRGLDSAWAISEKAIQEAYRSDATMGREDAESKLREQFLPEIKRMEEFWAHPWKSNGWSFGQWLNGVIEDHLVLDGVAIYPRSTYGGDVLDLEVVDATTIKPLLDYRGVRPSPPFPAFQQNLQGFPRGEFHATVAGTDADGNALMEGGYLADQLFYGVENVRSFTPYGLSAVENALISAKLYLARQGWMIAEYDDGVGPVLWLVPDGKGQGYGAQNNAIDGMNPRQRQEWEDSLNDLLRGNTKRRNRAKMSPPGMKPMAMPTVPEQYKAEYDLHLTKMLAGHFSVTMAELGFTETQGLGNSGMHEGQAEVEQRVGQRPDERMVAEMINELSHDFLRCPPEICFKFTSAESEDTAEQDAVNKSRRERATITLNDERREIGKPPLTIPEADMPMVFVGTGWIPLEGMAKAAEAKIEAEQALVEDQLATGEQGREIAEQTAAAEAEELSGQDAEKALEMAAYTRWRRKDRSRGRQFLCKTLEPTDWPGMAVPDDVDFDGWAWVAEEDIEKAAGGHDGWRRQSRDSKGRWVKLGHMRADSLGPDRPGKAVLDGLARDASSRRATAAPKPAAPAASRAPAELSTPFKLSAQQRAEQETRARDSLESPRQVRGQWQFASTPFDSEAEADAAREREVAQRADQYAQAMEARRLAALAEWEAENPEASSSDRTRHVDNASTTLGVMTTPEAPKLTAAQEKTLATMRANPDQVFYADVAGQRGFNVNSVPALERAGLVEIYNDPNPATPSYKKRLVRIKGDAAPTTPTVRADRLDGLSTADLVAQYDQATSSHAGRHTNIGPRQKRINAIVDMLAARADKGDAEADGWLMSSRNAEPATPAATDGRLRLTSAQAMTPEGQRYGRAVNERDDAAARINALRGRITTDSEQMRQRLNAAEVELAAAQHALSAPAPTEDNARAAIESLADQPGAWVSMRDLRAKLGGTKAEQDATISAMALRFDGVNLVPEDNQKTLSDADHAAAIDLGAGPQHLIQIEPKRDKIAEDALAEDRLRRANEAERAARAARGTPAPNPTPVPAAETGKAGPTARSVTGIDGAPVERQAALRETARKLDEQHAALFAANRAELERDLASERAYLARTDLDDAERRQHETMLTALETLERTPRGDAAVQATKAARELIELADAQGMIVMVSHMSSHGAGGGSPYFNVQAVSPDMKTGFKATFHTFKGNRDTGYGRMSSQVIKDGRASDASLTAIRDHVTNANKPAPTVETVAPRNVDPSMKMDRDQVQAGDWRWNEGLNNWEQIGMIADRPDAVGSRTIWGMDRETRLGAVPRDTQTIVARQAERPTLPPRAAGLKGLQRKAGEAAKRGDVYVIERTDNSYIGGGAAHANRKTYETYEVTGVTREGKVAKVRSMSDGPDGTEMKADHVFGHRLGYGTSSVIPGDKIDKEGLAADLRANTYRNSTTPKHHDDLRELGDVLYGRMKADEPAAAPAPKPARVAAPAAAPSVSDMMAANMATSVANPSKVGQDHGTVTNDQIVPGTRLQHNGTAWEVLEKPRKAKVDARGKSGKVFRARREDQGIEGTMRLNDGVVAPLAAPKGGAARPKADAASAAPLTGDAALAAAPKGVEGGGARGIDAKGAAAIERYRGKAFTEINRHLRQGGAPDATVREIDRVMGESRLAQPIVTHRAIGDVEAVFGAAAGRKLVGHEWTDAAPQSTSTIQDKADTFLATGGNRRAAARIVMRVPAGVGAVQLSDGRYEAELLLQRGLRMRVVSDTGPWRRGQKNPRTIEVEVIPA